MRSYLLSFLLSIILVLMSVFIPVKINNFNELNSVKLGYPLHYIIQNHSGLDPSSYPNYQNFVSPLEYPSQLLSLNFILSIIFVMIIIQPIRNLVKKKYNNSMK